MPRWPSGSAKGTFVRHANMRGGGGEFRSAADDPAMQGSDERNGPALDVVENPMPHAGMGDAPDRRSLEMLGQIETGGEMIATRPNSMPTRASLPALLHGLAQLGNHRIADGIALGRRGSARSKRPVLPAHRSAARASFAFGSYTTWAHLRPRRPGRTCVGAAAAIECCQVSRSDGWTQITIRMGKRTFGKGDIAVIFYEQGRDNRCQPARSAWRNARRRWISSRRRNSDPQHSSIVRLPGASHAAARSLGEKTAPDRIWLAARGERGAWQTVTYAQGAASGASLLRC